GDQAVDRGGRNPGEGRRIEAEDPMLYIYGVARNVLRESWAADERAASTRSSVAQAALVDTGEEAAAAERRSRCLDGCLAVLDEPSRRLITGYYEDLGRRKIDNRRALADAHGLSLEALRVRLCRIRSRLPGGMNRC